MSISKSELDELREKLDALELSGDQRHFLDKVLKIAWDHAVAQRQLDAQFDGCFEPEDAATIMAYPSKSITGPANIINRENPA